VSAPAAGRLLRERSPGAIAEAALALAASPPGRAATRRHAEAFGWEETSRGLLALFKTACGRPGAEAGALPEPG
jgi:hypothetical protein